MQYILINTILYYIKNLQIFEIQRIYRDQRINKIDRIIIEVMIKYSDIQNHFKLRDCLMFAIKGSQLGAFCP